MKRIYKFFIAVAAVAAVGCTTDATEDLGVNVGGQTTLTLSLDDTRTQLGDKADGVYALTWAENDAIQVNGSVSNALTADEAGATTATFTFNNGFGSAPYFVAYPATSTNNQVVFAAEQTHTSNTTFGNGAAVMYGYANELNSIKLNHLTGVLKIGVVSGTGELTFIKEVRISTVDRKPIAGAFTVDAEGKLTATEGATEVITYKAASDAGFPVPVGTSTSENPAYIHVAVPAGVYGELYVTLESTDGVMYKTVTTDSTKPINAGTVREFTSNIEFVPTATAETATDADEYLIANYGDLIKFKEAVEEGSTLDAVLVNDIEIPNVTDPQYPNWEPIDAPNYTGTVNGNGFAIKNLYAPLFDITAASFKGLHLVVDVTETVNPNFGAFARQLVANGNAPKVEHCSVTGAIKINTDVAPSTADSISAGAIGGLVGIAKGVKFNNCVNNASITVSKISSSVNVIATVGGIAGFANVGNSIFVEFSNCTNTGDIACNDNTEKCIARLGGIVSIYYGAGGDITFDNCNNSGDLSTGNGAALRQICIGGIISQPRCTEAATIAFANNTTNSGTITVYGTCSGDIRVGGIVGHSRGTITYNFNGPVTNSGAITVDASAQTYVAMGGVIGQIDDVCDVHFYNTTTNTKSADLSLYGTINNNARCGGIIGIYSAGAKQYFYFHTKTHTNNGDITFDGECEGKIYLGGIVGITEKVSINSIDNAKLINNGNVSIKEGAVITDYTCIAGLVSSMSNYALAGSDGQIVNTGTISFKGEAKSNFYMGGLIANTASGMTLCASVINTGDIIATGKIDTSVTTRVAGVVGGFGSSKAFKNTQCYCNITAYFVDDNGTVTPYPRVGMFTGRNSMTESDFNNNFIGGKIAKTATVSNGVVTPVWTELTETNCYGYVMAENEGKTTFTGVSFLSSKDAIVWGNYGN